MTVSVSFERLVTFVTGLFEAASCPAAEAKAVADGLAESNLMGHDSHGVLRVPIYLADLKSGDVAAGQRPQLLSESAAGAHFDGQRGLGQVAGEIVVNHGVAKARDAGSAIVTLRNVGHLGRLGRWAEQSARLGFVSLHFVNTTGGTPANVMLVAPFGGRTRRMSVNPMCIGVPRLAEPPIIMDATIAATAGGKVMAASNRGERLPPGQIIDQDGHATTEPEALFTGGAILPFGDHRGYALSFMIDVLAGALTGGGCSPQQQHPKMNNMTSIFIDQARVEGAHFERDLGIYVEWIKASPPMWPGGEVLLPGEVELRTAAKRRIEGIPLDATTLGQLNEAAAGFGLPPLAL